MYDDCSFVKGDVSHVTIEFVSLLTHVDINQEYFTW